MKAALGLLSLIIISMNISAGTVTIQESSIYGDYDVENYTFEDSGCVNREREIISNRVSPTDVCIGDLIMLHTGGPHQPATLRSYVRGINSTDVLVGAGGVNAPASHAISLNGVYAENAWERSPHYPDPAPGFDPSEED